MRVVHNEQVYFVGWSYDNPNNATRTECIMKDANKETVNTAIVKRYVHDKHDKEKARKFSLAKLLSTTYPGRENKNLRAKFWDAYIHRNENSKVKSVV